MIHLPAFWDSPTWRLRVACGALLPYFLTSLGTTTAVISLQTRQYYKLLLYYYRVIMGRLLLTPLPSITISSITQNQFSIFQLISYQVTTLRPFYINSSVLQFCVLATKCITSYYRRFKYDITTTRRGVKSSQLVNRSTVWNRTS